MVPQTRAYCYWWDIIPPDKLFSMKRLFVGWLLWVEPRSVRITLADGHCDLGWRWGGGGQFGWRPLWLGMEGHTMAFPYKRGKARKTCQCTQFGCIFRDNLGWSAEHQFTSITGGALKLAPGQHKCLANCRTKGVRASAKFESKLRDRALIWCAKNEILKFSWICLLPTY
jgi:hypothetical protein